MLLAGHCLGQTGHGAAARATVCLAGGSVSGGLLLPGLLCMLRLARLQLGRQGLVLPLPGGLRLLGGAAAGLCLAVQGSGQRPVLAAWSLPVGGPWV